MTRITEEEYMNYIKNLKDNLTTSSLAKIYNMSTIKFNKVLRYYKIQYKRNCNGKEKWILNSKFQNKGLQEVKYSSYIKSNGDVLTFKTQPKWTKKGICYIIIY